MSTRKRLSKPRRAREYTPTPEERLIMDEIGKAWGALADRILEGFREYLPKDAEIIPFSKPQK